MKNKILCVDDDLTVQTLVEASLKDYVVVKASSVKEAEDLTPMYNFCCIILDIELPDGDGLRLLSSLMMNQNTQKVPVLVFSNHHDLPNKVSAFSLGADDFISKPFDPIELSVRVSARVKKSMEKIDNSLEKQYGNLLLDLGRQKAFRIEKGEEKDLGLTGLELKILTMLTRRTEMVYSREQIMDEVWGNTYINDRTVDSHVAHLRQKLSETSVVIVTNKPFGYSVTLKDKR